MIQNAPSTNSSRSTDRILGTVKWFDDKKGFGFIISPGIAGDIFVHHSEIECPGFRTLITGEEVEFSITTDAKGTKAHGIKRNP